MELDRLKIDRSPKPKRAHRRRSLPVGPLLGVGLLALGAFLFRGRILAWVDRYRLPEVATVRVRRSHPAAVGAVEGKAANGYIVAARRAALSADTPGRIVEINVEEGSVVRQGDVVARLYSDEYAAALRQAEADLEVAAAEQGRAAREEEAAIQEHQRSELVGQATVEDVAAAMARAKLAEQELQRIEGLVAQRVLSDRDLDQARSTRDSTAADLRGGKARQEAALAAAATAKIQEQVARAARLVADARVVAATAARDLAQATLDKTAVRAPFDGIVVLKDAEVGEVVSPNSQGGSNARGSVCTMVDFRSLEVQADVPETSIAAVSVGAVAQVFLDAYPDTKYAATVSRIWPTANRQKATIEVRATFDAPDDRLRPEMGVRVVFPNEDAGALTPSSQETSAEALVVPTDCIVRFEGKSGVFVLERDQVRLQEVVLGAERSSRTVVLEGLVDGEMVVVEPPPDLEDGQRVLRKSSP